LKIHKITALLENEYGRPKQRQRTGLLDQLVSTILSQNTTDTNRDRAFGNLKKKFPDLMSIASSSPEAIEKAIRVGGLARIKSRRIYSIILSLKRSKAGSDLGLGKGMDRDAVRKHLMSFEGVGRKTADCVLLFGMGRDAFPVDTHVHRVSRRLGLVRHRISPEEAAGVLEGEVPPGHHYSLHINLIRHGRRICRPRNPKCAECCLRRLCDNNPTLTCGEWIPHA